MERFLSLSLIEEERSNIKFPVKLGKNEIFDCLKQVYGEKSKSKEPTLNKWL